MENERCLSDRKVKGSRYISLISAVLEIPFWSISDVFPNLIPKTRLKGWEGPGWSDEAAVLAVLVTYQFHAHVPG